MSHSVAKQTKQKTLPDTFVLCFEPWGLESRLRTLCLRGIEEV